MATRTANWPVYPPTPPELVPLVAASRGWDRTPRGKLICPDCGATGWPGGSWVWRHIAHEPTPCGRKVTAGYLRVHVAHCKDCQRLDRSRLTSPLRGYCPFMLSAIMTEPDFGEVCFLIALILFAIGFVITLAKSPWPYTRLLDYAGLGFLALGFLAL